MVYLLSRSVEDCPECLARAAFEATQTKPTDVAYPSPVPPFSMPRACFDNVHRAIAIAKGKAIRGWQLTDMEPAIKRMVARGMIEYDGLAGIDIETHCVWEDPGGSVWDITPPETRDVVRFVADGRVRHNLGLHVAVFSNSADRDRYRDINEPHATARGFLLKSFDCDNN